MSHSYSNVTRSSSHCARRARRLPTARPRLPSITNTASRTRYMTAADIRARSDGWLAQARESLSKLEAAPPKDRETLMRAIDELQWTLTNLASSVSVLVNVHPDKEARDACEDSQRESTKLSVAFHQSRPIYNALSKVDTRGLDGPAERMVSLTLQDMRRAGAHLDGAARARAQQLRLRITELSQAYARNLRDDVRTIELPESALDGTPADYRAAHPADANGNVKVTTDPPDMAPLQTYARSGTARFAIMQAYLDRARGNIEGFNEL